jgi:hypothetical protein
MVQGNYSGSFLWVELKQVNGWPGARDFRDFSRLPLAQENRGSRRTPLQQFTTFLRGDIFHGNRYRKNLRAGKHT